MTEIIVVGGGGHARSVIDVIESTQQFNIVGIIDKPEYKGNRVLNYEIKYSDEDLPNLVSKGYSFIIAVGQIKSPDVRIELYNKLKKLNASMPVIVSSHAYVSQNSKIGEGTVVMHGAIVNVNATIGVNCIINSKALIEHDAVVEDHCHISTGAILNGGTIVKSESFIGSNSVLRENLKIKTRSVIPAGTAVLRRTD